MYGQFLPKSHPDIEDWLRSGAGSMLVMIGTTLFWVRDGSLRGYINYYVTDDTAWLDWIQTWYKGEGYGTEMLADFEEYVRVNHPEVTTIRLKAINSTGSFYRGNGYKSAGDRDMFMKRVAMPFRRVDEWGDKTVDWVSQDGGGYGHIVFDERGDSLYLDTLEVNPRGKGYGTEMMDDFHGWYRENFPDAQSTYLDASESLEPFYAGVGYKPVGGTPNGYEGTDVLRFRRSARYGLSSLPSHTNRRPHA